MKSLQLVFFKGCSHRREKNLVSFQVKLTKTVLELLTIFITDSEDSK